jgi:hypothetical protein
MAAPSGPPRAAESPLTRKLGPLPAWQWGALAALGIAGAVILRRRAASSSTSSSSGAGDPSTNGAAGAVGIDPSTGAALYPNSTYDSSSNPNGPDLQGVLDVLTQDEQNEQDQAALGGVATPGGGGDNPPAGTPGGPPLPGASGGPLPPASPPPGSTTGGGGPGKPPPAPPVVGGTAPPPPRTINPGTNKPPNPQPVGVRNPHDYPSQIAALTTQGKAIWSFATIKNGKISGAAVPPGTPVYALIPTGYGPIWEQYFDPRKLPNGTKVGTLARFKPAA